MESSNVTVDLVSHGRARDACRLLLLAKGDQYNWQVVLTSKMGRVQVVSVVEDVKDNERSQIPSLLGQEPGCRMGVRWDKLLFPQNVQCDGDEFFAGIPSGDPMGTFARVKNENSLRGSPTFELARAFHRGLL